MTAAARLSLRRLGTSPPPPTPTRWNVTLASLCAHRASVSVPEPAEVIPTFLPSSSLTALMGDAVAAHDLDEHAALARRGYERNRHRPQIRRVRSDRLEGLAAAPVDRDLRTKTFLLEEPLLLRHRREDGREVGLGGAADADDFLRGGAHGQREHRAEGEQHREPSHGLRRHGVPPEVFTSGSILARPPCGSVLRARGASRAALSREPGRCA